MTGHGDIKDNLADVRGKIAAAAEADGRAAEAVSLVAVAKTKPVEDIEAALAAGQRIFGENRVQEAQSKYPSLKERHQDLELHLIGPLQTNKAEDAVALFDVIQTLDRLKLAKHLAKAMEKLNRRPELFIQVNTGEEEQKAGVAPVETAAFVKSAIEEHGLPVVGLMCIPPVEEDPSPHFALLKDLAKRCGLEKLSMGMSADYELAVRLGATHVRVGSAIFGNRSYP